VRKAFLWETLKEKKKKNGKRAGEVEYREGQGTTFLKEKTDCHWGLRAGKAGGLAGRPREKNSDSPKGRGM